MIFDGYRFAELHANDVSSLKNRSIASFVEFLEKKLSVNVLYDARSAPFERPELVSAMHIAEKLHKNGVVREVVPITRSADEPHIKSWRVVSSATDADASGGGSLDDDADALIAGLAECMERYIWREERDFFVEPLRATSQEISSQGAHVAPEQFASFSLSERRDLKEPGLLPEAELLWIRGTSLISGRPTYVPAQTVSGIGTLREEGPVQEPLIRERNTIGLATWPTLPGARLAGALEIIEREAFMTMWLNQLSLPRIRKSDILDAYPRLAAFVENCERYRLDVHFVRLLSDAPAHVICAVVEDKSGFAPRFSFGLKTHRCLEKAFEKSLIEALRLRSFPRRWLSTGNSWDPQRQTSDIRQLERSYYWTHPEHAQKLAFVVSGEETAIEPADWERDTEEQHLERLMAWCRERSFECVSVSLGVSAKNPTPWHIEMMIMPELQPTYLDERYRQTGGIRWRTIPEGFGIRAREEPYVHAPHPFI